FPAAASPRVHRVAKSRNATATAHAGARAMSHDVFVSYAPEDERFVREYLAPALFGEGFSVWWDRTLKPGEYSDPLIGQALQDASVWLVLWSRYAAGPGIVEEEALAAQLLGTYAAAKLDAFDPPTLFTRSGVVNLRNWRGNRRSPAFKTLTSAMTSLRAS